MPLSLPRKINQSLARQHSISFTDRFRPSAAIDNFCLFSLIVNTRRQPAWLDSESYSWRHLNSLYNSPFHNFRLAATDTPHLAVGVDDDAYPISLSWPSYISDDSTMHKLTPIKPHPSPSNQRRWHTGCLNSEVFHTNSCPTLFLSIVILIKCFWPTCLGLPDLSFIFLANTFLCT